MQLRSGLKLYSELAGVGDQLAINGGSMPAPADAGVYYHPGSYVPLHEWRKLEADEMRLLVSPSQERDIAKKLYLGEIPEALKDAFVSLGLQEVRFIEDVLPEVKKKEDEVKKISRQLEEFLRPLSSRGKYRFHKITRAMPNRETLSNVWIRDKNVYIGLHIDQSRDFTPHTAYKSGNRISINLGKETRHLAFVNLSMRQVYKMIREKSGTVDAGITADNIANLFFTYYPDYPVVRLAIRPYQYYIAPTDNFFHDATTIGKENIDVTIVYTGVFDTIH